MGYRVVKDFLGEVLVPKGKLGEPKLKEVWKNLRSVKKNAFGNN